MSERVKVGDVYLELPKGFPKAPIRTLAEKPEKPETLEVPAFVHIRNDPVQDYLDGSNRASPIEKTNQVSTKAPDLMAEWIAFCGEKSRLPGYWLQYQKQESKGCGYNVYASLFGLQWFFVNKMYVNGIISLFVEFGPLFAFLVATSSFNKDHWINDRTGMAMLLCASLLMRIAIGFWANIAIYKRANAEISRIRAFNLDSEMHLSLIRSAGAPALMPVILLNVCVVIIKVMSLRP
ncbi:MAG: hypothetical protein V4495_19625 [Pseudomonadota bacterium]